ncbi:MAG: succinylglutamate desuccinylase/aspartoacylase family protein [Nanoarchaeota archaeon]|nr:succinylglutamate desuccinylase/aspartoacylase family protein [Nanoarchaeota archaeon]MBU1623009.1 succinylglutamate desuccinylase/aspartoacylase family protein [Nanoarchaeota archaeon]MBU1974417.1 succinylglutamate desuccinylase/aspartoacylase family protein [Nanoarchaeota archaeon]
MPLQYFSKIPEQINLEPKEFLKWLGTTSVIKAGSGEESLVLFSLIHGNEPSGFYAFHNLLKKLRVEDHLQKTVYFVFTNVEAALHGGIFELRFTADQSDMNRIWLSPGKNEEQNELVTELKQFIKEKTPQLIVDFHNTTGRNPVYLITPPNLDHHHLKNYSYFTTFLSEDTDLTMLISWANQFVESFLIECGQNVAEQSHLNAQELLQRVLIYGKAKAGEIIPQKKVWVAIHPERVVVNSDNIAISDTNTGEDAVFRTDLDLLNTKPLPKGTSLGYINKPRIINHPKLEVINHELLLKEDATLILLTTHVPAIKATCLGYFVDVKEVEF